MMYKKQQLTLENVRTYIHEKGDVSFVDLIKSFHGTQGNGYILLNYDNCILWDGFSNKFIIILNELMNDGMKISTCDPLVYWIDGSVPNMPCAKKIYNYKKPRWLPVVLNI